MNVPFGETVLQPEQPQATVGAAAGAPNSAGIGRVCNTSLGSRPSKPTLAPFQDSPSPSAVVEAFARDPGHQGLPGCKELQRIAQ